MARRGIRSYDPLNLVDFDKAMMAHGLRQFGRGKYTSAIFSCCAMVDAEALSEVAETRGAEGASLNELLRLVLATHPDVWLAHDARVHHGASAGAARYNSTGPA